MTELTSSVAPPYPALSEKLKFYGIWVAVALLLLVLPKIFGSGGALTTFSLIGISIIFSLSYNILLGQTGLLSFGHAVYYGLGGFLVIHAINIISANKLPIPLPVVPLVGGLTGLFFAALLGWVSTQRSGTAFAMISLGVAELIASSALILRTFFGGEAGISANRTKLFRVFDWNFGPQIQIYYLVAAWTLLAVIAMYALTRTPLGRMCNAVRDNPERVQFVGYDPHVVRYLAFCFAGFFAGIAGALAAINFEIANSAYLGAAAVRNCVVFDLYRRRRLFHWTDCRRDIRYRAVSEPERFDTGLAALLRTVFHCGRNVCARRHHRASDDAPAAAQGRHIGQGIASLFDSFHSDARIGRRSRSCDRNYRASHRESGR